MKFASYQDLSAHMKKKHDPQLRTINSSFRDEASLAKWKLEVEEQGCFKFIRSAGLKKRKDGSSVEYLRCFRNGTFKTESKG